MAKTPINLQMGLDTIPRYIQQSPSSKSKALKKVEISKVFAKIGATFGDNEGVSEEFGLCLVHRHFDLGPNEILVETHHPDGTRGVAAPWTIFGCEIKRPTLDQQGGEIDYLYESLGLDETSLANLDHVHPQSWTFNETGGLEAFEFYRDSSPQNPSPPSKFVSQLYSTLKELDLVGIFGICRLPQGFHNKYPPTCWESTDLEKRLSVTERMSATGGGDGDAIVSWKYFEAGKFAEIGWCGICVCCTCK